MRILQVGKFYPPYQGGMETVLQNICEGLVGKGHQVRVICSHTEGRTKNEVLNGVEVQRLATFGSVLSQPVTPGLVPQILSAKNDFDLIHFHAPNPMAETAYLLSQIKCPTVVTYHSDIVRQKSALKFYLPVLKSFLAKVNRIVVASQQAVDHSPVLPEFGSKCRVVPFGIDGKVFAESVQNQSSLASLMESIQSQFGEHLLFVGRLVSYKGLDVLLRAMRRVDKKLVIVGKGPLASELQELSYSLGLGEKVSFLDRVDTHEELIAHYRACSAFVLPSVTRAEAFGMVMIEAMANGCPVISTKLPSGVSFVNAHGVSGLQCEPGDENDLAEKINQMFNEPGLRQKLASGAKQRFENEFTLGKMITSYEEVYREI